MLAEKYDVHVLTRSYSRPLIEGHPNARNLTFHYADYFGSARNNHIWRLIKPYYVIWQILVLFKVIGLNRKYRYDVIHHVTYNNIDVPGLLWLTPRARFIWGPVGGGQIAPRSLISVYGATAWKERVRGVLKASARYNPIIRGAINRASMVLFANKETAERLEGLGVRSVLMSETAISSEIGGEPIMDRPSGHRLRLLWLGYAAMRKGLVLAIHGFASALERSGGRTDMELVIIGEGESVPAAKKAAKEARISDSITFLGAIPHSEVDRHFAEADIFLFTSVQDTSGNVLLEAMRNAKPIIALNHQGAKALVTGGGARLVEIGTYAQTALGLGDAILELANDDDLRRRMANASLREVRERHTWAAKRAQVIEIYEGVMSDS